MFNSKKKIWSEANTLDKEKIIFKAKRRQLILNCESSEAKQTCPFLKKSESKAGQASVPLIKLSATLSFAQFA